MAAADASPVQVVGGGISGVACARELTAAGIPTVVWERARHVGGRMAVRTVDNRPIDVGASYFTAADPAFRAVADDWVRRGLARAWTDTFAVANPDGITGTTTGPLRYAAPRGLRALVEDLARGLYVERGNDVESVEAGPGDPDAASRFGGFSGWTGPADVPGPLLDGLPARVVVLAMPDPQAADLLDEDLAEELAIAQDHEWEATLTLYAGWDRRRWPDFDGIFVHDSPALSWVADDGRRRGDGAPVLVAHSTGAFAASCLDVPGAGLDPLLGALCKLLDIDREPVWAGVQRWSLSRPSTQHDAPFHLGRSGVGLCGDSWGERSRVEAAFLSGRALGVVLSERLGGGAGA